MIKLRHHLIIACALGLSVTGVFAAWTFGSFEPQEVELEASVSDVLPADRWNFDTVYVTFNAGSFGDFGLDSNGDEITTKNLSTFEGRQITYDNYKTLNLNVDDGYLFIGWAESDDNKPFEIDVIRSNENDSEEYIAQYIDLSTVDKSSVWSLYDYNDNILGTFIDNPHEDGSQQILYNIEFIVEDSKKAEQIYYVQNHSDTPTRHELKSKYNYIYNDVELYKANENNVKSGIYYVIFDPVNASNDYSWHAHGGHVYLHRLYQYSVVGDPSNTWDSSSDSLVTFGYVETREESSEKYKVYRADNVFFDGDMDFEFKLNEADSYPYFSDITHTYSETYINVTNDGNANYVLDKTALGTHDYYMMTFYINVYEHESNTVGNIYNYPRDVYLSVEIKRYTIYFYENSTLETPTSTYECKYNDPFPSEQFEPTNKFYTEWTDIDTHEIIDTSLGVIKDLHIYPSAYKDAVNVYFYNANTDSGTPYKHFKIEKGSTLGSAVVPNPTYSDYTFEGWATDSSAGSLAADALTKTYTADTKYYAKHSKVNYLKVGSSSSYTNSTGTDTSNIYFEIKTSKNTTVQLMKHIAYTTTYVSVKSYTVVDTIVSSGFYQIYFNKNNYSVTQKRIVQIKIHSEAGTGWTNSSPWMALYSFVKDTSTNQFYYDYRGKGGISFGSTYKFYIDMKYNNVIAVAIKNGYSDVGNNWANKAQQTQDIALSNNKSNNSSWTTSYSSSNFTVNVYGNYNLGWAE